MRILFVVAAILCLSSPALAQNTGGVFGPSYGPDHKSAQYRLSVDPDDGASAHRVHYQQSIDHTLGWRIVGQLIDASVADVDVDFLQAEVTWELTEPDSAYRTGLRFDARLRPDDRSEQLGLNWANQWTLTDGWSLRAVALTSVQIGSGTSDALALQARGQLAKTMDNGVTLGAQAYLPLGTSEDIQLLKGKALSAGPFVSVPLDGKRALFLQPLFGLSDTARDVELRLWLTQGF